MKSNEKVIELIENVGNFIQFWGFKKIHGRVWSLLFISDKPLSTPEIIKELKISKGLASSAINDLLEHKLIQKCGEAKFGGFKYDCIDDVAETVRNVIRNRELVLLEKIEKNLKEIDIFKNTDKKELCINAKKVKTLLSLTKSHKKFAYKLSKLKIKTVEQWSNSIDKLNRFL